MAHVVEYCSSILNGMSSHSFVFYQLQGVFFVNIDLLSKKNMSPAKMYFVDLSSFKGFLLALDFF